MVFSSSIFLFLFLPVVLGVYYVLDRRFRNWWLLLVSLLFYMWGEPKNIVIMLVSIAINYSFGIIIHALRGKPKALRRLALSAGIAANLALLFRFKYFDFSVTTVNTLFGSALPLKHIALPIGISFFTFQGMTYVIDLYWGNTKVQKNPFKIGLYISLFPQLIAGPIVRYKDVAAQIESRAVTLNSLYEGVERFIVGLGKKVIIANTVALVADQIFALPFSQLAVPSAWLGIVCYAIQIYFDFSGYSDMAIGLGKMFGFDFLENFDFPYISRSITEFWRRWHISLSTFFRDYLYIPLGGNRRGNVYVNLFIVFFATGLWHGASWNFVVWGLWHGAFMLIERLFRGERGKVFSKVPPFFQRAYTLGVVLIGWVFFRAPNLSYAMGYLRIMFGLQTPQMVGFTVGYYLDAYLAFILGLAVVGTTPLGRRIAEKLHSPLTARTKPLLFARAAFLALVLLSSAMLVMTSSYNPFIYFRF